MHSPRHLLSSADLSAEETAYLLDLAAALKRRPQKVLVGRHLALLFEKASLRTRVSFEIAMDHLGAFTMYLDPREVGLGEREAIRDVSRVLARYVDIVAVRTYGQSIIEEYARFSSIPVINALTDEEHPCQALADLLTLREHMGDLRGRSLAFVGDGNNVSTSLVIEAVRGAEALYTDVWTSMGQEREAERRKIDFAAYQLNAALVAHAKPGAFIMHDLPAHRGEEITDDVFESPHAIIFDQAENRVWAQAAVVAFLLGADRSIER
jgi:ornithine carbamoyltransferase